MLITLELPEELQPELEREAVRQGLSIAEYVLQMLIAELERVRDRPRNGAELVAMWAREGLIGSRPHVRNPDRYARDLRERTQMRRRG